MTLLNWIGWLLWIPVFLTGAYLLVFALAGLRRAGKRKAASSQADQQAQTRIAVLVPAYREDAVIVETTQRLLQMTYPPTHWDLVIIGDHLKADTIGRLRSLPIRLVELNQEVSTKAKALNAALGQLSDSYDLALVLDADNAMDADALWDFDRAYQAGARVIQARRVAKNENSSVAVLDAISEEVNNTIFCQGHRRCGLSSRLIGSGMAFHYPLFKAFMARNKAVGGFDKELELTLMQAGEIIEYLPDTWIYDEKVSQTAHFKRQRLRWISAQYHYLGRFLGPALKELFRGRRLSFVDKTFQLLLLPRLVLVGTATVGMILSALFAGPALQQAWLLAFVSVFLAYAIATPARFYRMQTLTALLHLPQAFFHLLWELRGVHKANRKFIHTPHGSSSETARVEPKH